MTAARMNDCRPCGENPLINYTLADNTISLQIASRIYVIVSATVFNAVAGGTAQIWTTSLKLRWNLA